MTRSRRTILEMGHAASAITFAGRRRLRGRRGGAAGFESGKVGCLLGFPAGRISRTPTRAVSVQESTPTIFLAITDSAERIPGPVNAFAGQPAGRRDIYVRFPLPGSRRLHSPAIAIYLTPRLRLAPREPPDAAVAPRMHAACADFGSTSPREQSRRISSATFYR